MSENQETAERDARKPYIVFDRVVNKGKKRKVKKEKYQDEKVETVTTEGETREDWVLELTNRDGQLRIWATEEQIRHYERKGYVVKEVVGLHEYLGTRKPNDFTREVYKLAVYLDEKVGKNNALEEALRRNKELEEKLAHLEKVGDVPPASPKSEASSGEKKPEAAGGKGSK